MLFQSDYTVEYSSDSGTTWTTFADGTSTTASTTVTGLSHSTTYTFRVSAVNVAGTGTASATASVATATTAGAPTGLTATQGVAEAALSWTAPASDGGAALTDYTVEYSSDSGSTWATFTDGTSATTSATVTGLSHSTTYTFRVSAVNAAGTGTTSDTASVATVSEPDPPTALSATTGIAEVDLSWTAPSSNGGSAVTDYTVEYSSDSGTTWATFSDGSSTTASATVTGLDGGTSYLFRVSAINAAGTGTASNTTTATFRSLTGRKVESGVSTYSHSSGRSTSDQVGIAVGSDGNAVIVFAESSRAISSVWCGTATCTDLTDASTNTLFAYLENDGLDPAIAVPDGGYPVVAFREVSDDGTAFPQSLSLVFCNNGYVEGAFDSSCSSSTKVVVDSGDSEEGNLSTKGRAPSIAIGNDGYPVVSYFAGSNATTGELRIAVCTSANCGTSEITTIANVEPGDRSSSVVIGSDGNPLVAYRDSGDVKMVVCANTSCTSSSTTTLGPLSPLAGSQVAMATSVATEHPIVAYNGDEPLATFNLDVTACTNADCSTGTQTEAIDQANVNINGGLEIATDSNGLPVIAFINNSALNLYECSASDCSSGTRYVIDQGSLFGGVNGGRTGDGDYTPSGEVAIALTSDDTRLIAYGASGDSLYLAVLDAP